MLPAEVEVTHFYGTSFAQLHMAAAQRLQAPAEETRAPSNEPSIPAEAQLERALTEARSFEATISASQTKWTREALRRTACVSYIAIETCKMAAQDAWAPWECCTYHDLLDREEGKLDKAFGNMMPDELSGEFVAAPEVWLDDAYDNITLAQACMTARREQEEERLATLRERLEVPNGETSADKARRLWILKALKQTSWVSQIAREMCDDSTKTDWTSWTYREYRRQLDEDMMAVCQIYAEVELADLPVREGKRARGWLTSAHKDVEYAREQVGARIRSLEELGTLLHPVKDNSSGGAQQEKQAEDAAAQARLQASRTPEVPKRSQVAGEAGARTTGTRSGRLRNPAYLRAPNGAETGLADTTSESDISDPGGMPQLFRKSLAPDTRSRRAQRAASRRQRAGQESALKLTAAGGPRKKAIEPPLLMKHGHMIRQEGIAKTGAITRITPKARKENEGGVRRDVAVKGAGGRPTAEASESLRRGQLRGPGVSPDLVEVKAGRARAPVPNKPPVGNDEFA
jgi:hypothetical protein